ncbi:AI-2E family transporter [Agaribacterium haliotis]|uniref:AI-2E family transporter n=1 Tax=Agaribacterium haliotis TaxID=2013869 RepID=UPI000BB54401|nr:AI-2E family transporter [Agaribacterium haliotis]
MPAQSPIARFLVVLAAFVVVVAGMKAAESLLVPFLLSLFIAIISSPPLMWMRQKGLPTWLALLSIVSVLVILSVLIGVIIGSSIAEFRTDLPSYQLKLQSLTTELFDKLEHLGVNVDLDQIRQSFDPAKALAMAGNTLASFGNLMTNFFLILLTVVFILAEEVSFSDKLRVNDQTRNSLEAIRRFTAGVNRYVAIKTMVSLLTGLMILTWLWVLGLDYFVLWGLFAFLLNFIPTFGSILAAIPAVLLALVQLGFGDALLVGMGFLLVNFIVGNVLEPRIMGKGLDLSALIVFLSLVFWGWVLGPVGMLLSIPLTMTVRIALESFEDTRWIGVMMGSGTSPQDSNDSTMFLAAADNASGENKKEQA